MFWRTALADEDREVTRSLKALKTLSNQGGRVSIEPDEVLLQPGYLLARRAAALFIRQTKHHTLNWEAIDEASLALLQSVPDKPSPLPNPIFPLTRKNRDNPGPGSGSAPGRASG